MRSELEEVLKEYNQLGVQQQLDYDKFYLYSIITHSTAIEGSTVTEIENQLLFDEGISANFQNGGQKNQGGQKKWSETTQKVYELIKSNPHISRKQLCDELNINPSAVQKHIEKLKEQNVITRKGGAKGGWWEILI